VNDEPIDLAHLVGPAEMSIVVIRADGSQELLSAISLAAGDKVTINFEEHHG